MRSKHLLTQAAWLWLPLFVGTCVVLGCYRSYLLHAAAGQASSCAGASQLEQFLHCP